MELTTKTLNDLAKIMSAEKLTSLDIEQGNLKIKIKREVQSSEAHFPERPSFHETPIQQLIHSVPAEEIKALETVLDSSLTEIKSPMVGVYYQSNNPEGEAYISVGQSFSEGDTLCIIEAMKLMNEISAESSGIIMEVCVENGQVVEYGQVLYRIKEGKQQ
ncbi:acetyl-CoA carboxylase biotin carboxyl carrier protein [Acetobacterium sp.]|uniref:acetyl-CoA carboxylase biotin carboxyl carrier protein n=1 Tax=Acetobacterium sp. TaxID=1872094 RepID=UPI002F3F995A